MIYQEDIYSNPTTYKPTGTLRAFCNSMVCVPGCTVYNLGKEKHVSKHTVCCKDCGSALYWVHDSEIYKFKGKK